VDILFKEFPAEEVRQSLKRNAGHGALAEINSVTLEDGVSWLHIDIRNGNAGVNSFKP
jgi:hypothetical protein